jgi:hypothetical protein
VTSNIIVLTKNSTQFELTSLQIIYIGTQGELIDEALFSDAISSDINDVDGAVYISKANLPIDEQILEAQNNGAVAVIYASPTYYAPGYLRYRWNNKAARDQITIPVFELGLIEGRTFYWLYNKEDIVNVTLLPNESVNEWQSVLESPGNFVWQAFLAAFCAANIGLASWKLRSFVKYYGKMRSSISFYVLVIEIISNAIRLVLAVDPMLSNNLYPEPVSVAFGELSFPFALASFMLFTLYWHEMMTKSSVVVHPFITKMRIPFFILSFALLALQIIRILLRSFTTLTQLPLVTAIAYLLVIVGMAVFYTVTGVKLLKRLNRSKNLGRVVKLRQSTIKILVSASFLVSFVIFAILFVSGVAYYPISYLVVFYLLWTAICAASVMNILAFQPPSGRSSGSSNKSSGTAASATSLAPFESKRESMHIQSARL